MAQGFKTGGRKKGTPNKRTEKLLKLIEEKYPDFDPVLALVEMIQNPYTSSTLKAYCIKAALPYFYPKKKPVETEQRVPEAYTDKDGFTRSQRRRSKFGGPDYGSDTTVGYL